MSATPLLDVQSDPTLTYNFEGLYTINIANFMHADSVPYRCLDSDEENAQPLATVAHLNCSQTRCALDGLTISGAGYESGPAVRIIRGRGTVSTFITDPSHSPEGANGVVDGLGKPAGSYVGLTGVGLQFVGGSADRVLQFGMVGESDPRVTVGADGSLSYHSFAANTTVTAETTTVSAVRSNITRWDPEPLAPGAATRFSVPLRGSLKGDVAAASLDSIDVDEFVQLSAIAGEDVVAVVLRNAATSDGKSVDIAAGKLRVVVTGFKSDDEAMFWLSKSLQRGLR